MSIETTIKIKTTELKMIKINRIYFLENMF